MADTTFVNGTVVEAAWLNEVNNHVHQDSPISPATTVHAASVIGIVDGGSKFTGDTVEEVLQETATLEELAANGGSDLIGFIQAGIGAIAQTVQDKLRDAINVKDFGAVGNGTTDDTTSFSNAITAAGTSGTLYIPPGTYKITSQLTVTSKIKICGAGKAVTFLVRSFSPGSDDVGLFKFTTASGISIDDLEIYSATGTTGGCLISLVPHATNGSPDFMVMRNLLLTYESANTYKYAIYINGSARADNIGVRDITFDSCEVFGGTSGAMYLDTIVNFKYAGSTFPGTSTSGKVIVTGSGANDSAYVFFDCGAINGLALDNCSGGNFKAASFTDAITNANTASNILCIGDMISFQENWVNSVAINTRKMITSKATKGYTYLPNGMLMQWDTFNATTSWASRTFAIAFPTQCVSITGSCTATAQSRIDFQNVSASGYDVTSSPASCQASIIAIGW